jgi:hypothetical protein
MMRRWTALSLARSDAGRDTGVHLKGLFIIVILIVIVISSGLLSIGLKNKDYD